MISNTYVGLSLLGICAVVGAGVGIGSGVAIIAQASRASLSDAVWLMCRSAAQEAVKQEQLQQAQAVKIPAVSHSVFEKIYLDRGFAAREA